MDFILVSLKDLFSAIRYEWRGIVVVLMAELVGFRVVRVFFNSRRRLGEHINRAVCYSPDRNS